MRLLFCLVGLFFFSLSGQHPESLPSQGIQQGLFILLSPHGPSRPLVLQFKLPRLILSPVSAPAGASANCLPPFPDPYGIGTLFPLLNPHSASRLLAHFRIRSPNLQTSSSPGPSVATPCNPQPPHSLRTQKNKINRGAKHPPRKKSQTLASRFNNNNRSKPRCLDTGVKTQSVTTRMRCLQESPATLRQKVLRHGRQIKQKATASTCLL